MTTLDNPRGAGSSTKGLDRITHNNSMTSGPAGGGGSGEGANNDELILP